MISIRFGGWRNSLLLLFPIFLLILTGCGARDKAHAPLPMPRLANEEAVVEKLREGLKGHAASIHVLLPDEEIWRLHAGDLAADWMERALAETDDPSEGDYLRYQMGGYQANLTSVKGTDGTASLRLSITPVYYLYLAQEEEAQAAMEALLHDLALDGAMEERQKIQLIYDAICGQVRYDMVHQDNPYYTLRSTMYSALVHHTATCQGYAVTLYRLLREAGIEARIVTGTGVRMIQTAAGGLEKREEYHAWNLVRLGEEDFGLDATWDAGRELYQYFLTPVDAFDGHIPN